MLAFVVSTTIPFALWLAVSRRLPHRGTGWMDLVPGALLVGVGFRAFQQIAIWFLAPRLANATQLYGLLGIVATALSSLYVLGRLMVGAATLNASIHEQRSAAAIDESDPGAASRSPGHTPQPRADPGARPHLPSHPVEVMPTGAAR